MKKLPKQLSENIIYAKENYCFIKCDEDGSPEITFGHCDFTGMMHGRLVELIFDDESMSMLVDYQLAYALVNHDDFSGELDKALSA